MFFEKDKKYQKLNPRECFSCRTIIHSLTELPLPLFEVIPWDATLPNIALAKGSLPQSKGSLLHMLCRKGISPSSGVSIYLIH